MTSIPEEAPAWSHSLFTGKDHAEAAIADLSGYVGRVIGMVAPLGPELNQIRGLLEATALRVRRLDQERELPLIKIGKLRQEVREMQQARRTNPGVRLPSSPDDQLTTGQREAITKEEAERIAREVDEQRAKDERIRALEADIARRDKIEAETKDNKKDSWRFWRTAVVGLLSAIVAGYAVYRFTRPDVSQTIEYTQPKVVNSGK